jgi:uncharacterized protein YecE (DUF72 family)
VKNCVILTTFHGFALQRTILKLRVLRVLCGEILFYPAAIPQKDRLKYHADRFEAVEVNATFYRLPEARIFESWFRNTPDDFLFALKVSRYLTHLKRLKDP